MAKLFIYMLSQHTHTYKYLYMTNKNCKCNLQWAHQLVCHCQAVIPENIDTCNKCTQQIIFKNAYLCSNTYIHAIIISGKRGHAFGKGEGIGRDGIGIREDLEGRKGKKKFCN